MRKRVKITIEAYYYINPEEYLEDTVEDAIGIDLANLTDRDQENNYWYSKNRVDLSILADILSISEDLSVSINPAADWQ